MPTTKKSPLAQMKDKFGDKEKLVDRVLSVLPFTPADKDAATKKLLAISNQKLLRMFEVGSEIREKYGSPEKLVDALAQAAGKAKDQAYVARLTKIAQKTPSRVLDMMKSAAHGAKKAARKATQAA